MREQGGRSTGQHGKHQETLIHEGIIATRSIVGNAGEITRRLLSRTARQ